MMDKWVALGYTVLLIIGFGVSMERHGKKREVKDNALFDLTVYSVLIFVLWWGGFYNGWLQ